MRTERDLELVVLRAFCQGTIVGPARERGHRMLESYTWREPIHQALFEIIVSVPQHKLQSLPDLLPARLTRRGFPDFNFHELFEVSAFPLDRVQAAIQQLTRKP
jgi:hypothetical protein